MTAARLMEDKIGLALSANRYYFVSLKTHKQKRIGVCLGDLGDHEKALEYHK